MPARKRMSRQGNAVRRLRTVKHQRDSVSVNRNVLCGEGHAHIRLRVIRGRFVEPVHQAVKIALAVWDGRRMI